MSFIFCFMCGREIINPIQARLGKKNNLIVYLCGPHAEVLIKDIQEQLEADRDILLVEEEDDETI